MNQNDVFPLLQEQDIIDLFGHAAGLTLSPRMFDRFEDVKHAIACCQEVLKLDEARPEAARSQVCAAQLALSLIPKEDFVCALEVASFSKSQQDLLRVTRRKGQNQKAQRRRQLQLAGPSRSRLRTSDAILRSLRLRFPVGSVVSSEAVRAFESDLQGMGFKGA